MTIHTKVQYEEALAELEELMRLDPEPSSTDGVRLDELAQAIEEYEEEHYPME